MTAWKAVGWFWLLPAVGIAGYLFSGSPWAPRKVATPTQAEAQLPMGGGASPGRQPTPRGRCWLAPSRVKPLDRAITRGTLQETMAACALAPYGCVFDVSGEAYALEEAVRVQCAADGAK